ncbi:hypothetical protein MA16_Dca029067 [Dendrobium catenatum]|uniref:Uncharacterized protein n=1 Tax=Dendrobium catenatum TaxID=906689 RepID=A0A2I0VF85_9ASPA|nr:hypothetical protein MA16_Dca029067 [Dendrobium catenatum]
MATGQIHLQDSDLVQPRGKGPQTVQMVSSPSHSPSQTDSQGSSSSLPQSSEGEWQLVLSKKTKRMIDRAVQSSEAVERRPPEEATTGQVDSCPCSYYSSTCTFFFFSFCCSAY